MIPVNTDSLNFTNLVGRLNNTNNVSSLSLTNISFASTSGAFIISGNAITLNGMISNNNASATQTINFNIALAGTRIRTNFVTTGGTTILNGVISGSDFIKTGAGTLVLNGNNTFTGIITNSAGTIRLGNANALGTTAGGTVIASGATLDLNGQTVGAEALILNGTGVGSLGALVNNSGSAASLSGAITLAANSSIGGTGNMTLGGAISGAFTLDKVGVGTISFTGTVANTYSGLTTVRAGELDLGKVAGLNAIAGNLTVSNGTVKLLANDQIINSAAVIINGTGTLNLNGFKETISSLTNGGTVAVSGVAGAFTNSAAAVNSGFISVNTGASATFGGTFQNLASGVFTGNLATITFNAAVTNSGKFVMNQANVNFNNSPVLNNGTYTSQNSTSTLSGVSSKLTVGATGAIVSSNDVFRFQNGASFANLSTQSNTYNTASSKFLFQNSLSITQTLLTAGLNFNTAQSTSSNNVIVVSQSPTSLAGFSNNFALGTLEIANSTTVRVDRAFTGAGDTNEALYVQNLILNPNAFLIIATGVSVYFVTSNSWSLAKVSLMGGIPGVIRGGEIHQIAAIPEPAVAMLWIGGLATLVVTRRRAKKKKDSSHHSPPGHCSVDPVVNDSNDYKSDDIY